MKRTIIATAVTLMFGASVPAWADTDTTNLGLLGSPAAQNGSVAADAHDTAVAVKTGDNRLLTSEDSANDNSKGENRNNRNRNKIDDSPGAAASTYGDATSHLNNSFNKVIAVTKLENETSHNKVFGVGNAAFAYQDAAGGTNRAKLSNDSDQKARSRGGKGGESVAVNANVGISANLGAAGSKGGKSEGGEANQANLGQGNALGLGAGLGGGGDGGANGAGGAGAAGTPPAEGGDANANGLGLGNGDGGNGIGLGAAKTKAGDPKNKNIAGDASSADSKAKTDQDSSNGNQRNGDAKSASNGGEGGDQAQFALQGNKSKQSADGGKNIVKTDGFNWHNSANHVGQSAAGIMSSTQVNGIGNVVQNGFTVQANVSFGSR